MSISQHPASGPRCPADHRPDGARSSLCYRVSCRLTQTPSGPSDRPHIAVARMETSCPIGEIYEVRSRQPPSFMPLTEYANHAHTQPHREIA